MIKIFHPLVLNPAVLLLDEPLSSLDARLRVRMRREIRELQRAVDITMLYVTHDQEEALSISDRVSVLNGALFWEGFDLLTSRVDTVELAHYEIGRASCRERV